MYIVGLVRVGLDLESLNPIPEPINIGFQLVWFRSNLNKKKNPNQSNWFGLDCRVRRIDPD